MLSLLAFSINTTLNDFLAVGIKIVRALGYVYAAWAIYDVAMGLRSSDSGQFPRGLVRFAAACVLINIWDVLGVIGVNINESGAGSMAASVNAPFALFYYISVYTVASIGCLLVLVDVGEIAIAMGSQEHMQMGPNMKKIAADLVCLGCDSLLMGFWHVQTNLLNGNEALKATAASIVKPFSFWFWLVRGAMSIAGIAVFIFGVVGIVQSLQSHDNSSIVKSFMFTVGGLLLVGISVVVSVFGL